MAENQVDGGSAEGTVTNVNGGASGNQGVQQPSFDAAQLQSTLDALNNGFKTLEARVNGLQSVKDKDKQELSGLKQKIAEYEQLKEKFGSDGAIEQIELKQTLSEMRDQLSKLSGSTSTQTTDNSASGAVNAAQAFLEMGLDLKDPRVSVALTKQYTNDDAAIAAAYRLSKQLASSPTPTEAQGAAIQGKPPVPADVEALTLEYKRKMLEARGQRSKGQLLKQEYRQKGVDVDSVSFSV